MSGILLTGATGLIGAEVYRRLSATHNIVRLGRRPECEIQADLSKPETLKDLRFDDCETVIHCAGVTDEDFKLRPVEAFVQSTLGMNALIQTAIGNQIKRFFYISTSHVYGTQAGLINEETPTNPMSDYGIAHYAAEQTLRRNAEKIGNCFVLRPNAVFGEPVLIDNFDRWTLIPYSFPLEAVYNKKIVLRSSGEQNRNLVGTEDIVNCIENLFSITPEGNFTIVNPVGKETISVYQFAEKTAEIYLQVTDEMCAVERPMPNDGLKEEEFIYQTKFDFKKEKADLKTYLIKFISRISKDYKNDKKYRA